MKGYGLRTGNPLDKRLYEIWRKMHYRCENPKHEHFDDYGGRGIKVCEEWKSLIVFGKWALENGYSEELTLDRIDNTGNYEPSNCKWATKKEQNTNRRTTQHKIKSKTFSVRQRNERWEYRIEATSNDNKRHQITKCGFKTKQDAIDAAKKCIEENSVSTI